MASNTEIANLAIGHLGVGKEIANLDTENSKEAMACRRFFSDARDATLRDFNWPFARRFRTLTLVEEDPNDEWGYSYRYPTNCLAFRRILSGIRNDTRQSRIPYLLANDDDGELILTDKEDAQGEYTVKITDPARFSADFRIALSLRLAAYIAPWVAGGDPFKLGQRALTLYQFEISKAQATAGNEEQAEEPPESEYVRARE